MSEPENPDPDADAAVDALIEEFGGDPRAAISALLHDVDVLARDYGAGVSRGYVRHGRTVALKTIDAAKLEDWGRER